MDINYIKIMSNRYESVSSAQMTKSLGKSVINLYLNIACSALGVRNQQNLTLFSMGYVKNTTVWGGIMAPPCNFGVS